MTLSSQLQRFNRQAASSRAAMFGAPADGANPLGPNLQIGTVAAGATEITWGATFRDPFDRLSTVVAVIQHGRTKNCTAVIHVQDAHGLTVTEASVFRHIATGEVYDVGQLHNSDTAGYTRVLLHRREE